MTSIGLDIRPSAKQSDDGQVARQRRTLGVQRVRSEGQHEKQPAQHVPSLGQPGHRFDVQRMNGKDRRHPGTGPKIAGHPQQDQEQEAPMTPRAAAHWSDSVPPDSGHRAGSPTCGRRPSGDTTHLKWPSVSAHQSPDSVNPASNVRILIHECLVVEPDELVAHRLTKDEANGQQEKTADGPNPIEPAPAPRLAATNSNSSEMPRRLGKSAVIDGCQWGFRIRLAGIRDDFMVE